MACGERGGHPSRPSHPSQPTNRAQICRVRACEADSDGLWNRGLLSHIIIKLCNCVTIVYDRGCVHHLDPSRQCLGNASHYWHSVLKTQYEGGGLLISNMRYKLLTMAQCWPLVALMILTRHFPRVTLPPHFPRGWHLPSPGPCQAHVSPSCPQLTISGPDVTRARGSKYSPVAVVIPGCCCITGASSQRDNIHCSAAHWMELLINTPRVPGPALGWVTPVAVGLICFNLLLDGRYISQTPGGRLDLRQGVQTRPETKAPHCPQSHNPALHFELFLSRIGHSPVSILLNPFHSSLKSLNNFQWDKLFSWNGHLELEPEIWGTTSWRKRSEPSPNLHNVLQFYVNLSPDLIQTLFIQAFLAIIQSCVREVREQRGQSLTKLSSDLLKSQVGSCYRTQALVWMSRLHQTL